MPNASKLLVWSAK